MTEQTKDEWTEWRRYCIRWLNDDDFHTRLINLFKRKGFSAEQLPGDLSGIARMVGFTKAEIQSDNLGYRQIERQVEVWIATRLREEAVNRRQKIEESCAEGTLT